VKPPRKGATKEVIPGVFGGLMELQTSDHCPVTIISVH